MRYHIQSENWPPASPPSPPPKNTGYLVSHIFKSGVLVKKIKTSYDEVLPSQAARLDHLVRLALQWQHEAVLKLLDKA